MDNHFTGMYPRIRPAGSHNIQWASQQGPEPVLHDFLYRQVSGLPLPAVIVLPKIGALHEIPHGNALCAGKDTYSPRHGHGIDIDYACRQRSNWGQPLLRNPKNQMQKMAISAMFAKFRDQYKSLFYNGKI
jgi:hypothetical protein